MDWLTGAISLFTGLSTAGLRQNRLPLDLRLVIGVDRGGHVQSLLQVLASAGVKHRPLSFVSELATTGPGPKEKHTRVGVSVGTQEMKTILDLPREKPGSVHSRSRHQYHQLAGYIIPLALAGKLVLDVVHSITRGSVTLVVAGRVELVAENLIVGLLRNLIKHDLLLVVGNLEDDELGLVALAVAAHAEVVECVEHILLDGDTNGGSLSSV